MIDKLILYNLSKAKKTFLYRVEKGEDLRIIAEKFHTTQAILVSRNCLKEEVKGGEYIVVERADGEEYIVMPGDNLNKIAQSKGKKLQELKSKNQIDEVYVGQKIYI